MKLIITALCIISFEFAMAQNKTDISTHCIFNTVLGDKHIGTLSITNDSVIVGRELNGVSISKNQYSIVEKINKDSYTLIFAEYKQSAKGKKWGPVPKPFTMYMYHMTNGNLQVWQSMVFANLEDAKKAFTGVKVEDQYFMTWYDHDIFTKYLKYPEINTIGKDKMQAVVSQWIAEINENKTKIKNTGPSNNIFDYSEDVWTKCLINNKINPHLTFPQIYDHILACHMSIPSLRWAPNNEIIMHFDTQYAKQVTIE
ncbi:MAG: hypothetical protein V4592_22830 [Bacteroidota bacterium]